MYKIIGLILLIILTTVLTYYYMPKIEKFSEEYYKNTIETISVPVDFYNTSFTLSEDNYLYEMKDRFFLDLLDKNKRKEPYVFIKNIQVNNQYILDKLLDRTNKYILQLLNDQLLVNNASEKYIFNMVYSKIKETINDSDYYKVTSEHLIYRDTKVYGVLITLTTIHNLNTPDIAMIDYVLNGYIFEDKLTEYIPSNLLNEDYQNYLDDNLIKKDEQFEKDYLCKHYDELKRYRHILTDYKCDGV